MILIIFLFGFAMGMLFFFWLMWGHDLFFKKKSGKFGFNVKTFFTEHHKKWEYAEKCNECNGFGYMNVEWKVPGKIAEAKIKCYVCGGIGKITK